MILTLLLPVAHAGYGDVDADAYPTASEREVHLWTNAARVDPEAFGDAYAAGGCSTADFSDDELTPKAPVYYSRELNEAARFHSEDMRDNDWFAHESSDGTSFADRLAAFYDSASVGENIAYGYSDAFATVMEGWMCSHEGHRANIMATSWLELGTGVAGTYITQDFGGGSADTDAPVAMGIHTPEHGTTTFDLYADWQDAEPPARLAAVVDGTAHDMSLIYGVDTQGIYVAPGVEVDGDCHEYWFSWQTAAGDEGGFPETGSYLMGPTCEGSILWVDHQQAAGDDRASGKGSVELIGCAAAPGRAASLVLAAWALLVAAGHRRRI